MFFLKGALVLAGSGLSMAKFPVLLSKQPEAKPFMDVRFRGVCLRAELHGEDMDGVLASATLDDLGVYEVGFSCKEMEGGAWTAGFCRWVT